MSAQKKYQISEERKKEFAGIFVLEYIINRPHEFSILLEGDDKDLETILEWLLVREYVEIKNQESYIPTPKGRECLKLFLARYSEYLNVFDIYCAVDLESGTFAFKDYFEYENPEDWKKYLNDERWEDLRIAVATRKKMDPIEIVFMSFIRECRFGKNEAGWQFDLLLGSIWDEILDICNTALKWEDFGYEDEEGEVTASEVIDDIISQGAELMVNLHKREASFANKEIEHDSSDDEEDYVVERVEMEEYPYGYYEPYYDPFYISPLWLAVWLI
ncbi:hypothetical protein MNBD_UNCLBAC01-43 [hydrothermal vent metagenome]|uniref:Uncharacterized protein n=1 Tax=hydrothermal vent metagenome TaxID=652676 RepID=A0A3B1DK44_9ZZZZ